MAKSLADQLVGAGLADKKQARKAQHEKRQQARKPQPGTDDARERLERERAEKAERDRALNRERQQAEQARALRAQVGQLVRDNAVDAGGDIAFNFTDARINRIKRISVNASVQNQLARRVLAICADGDDYRVVPRETADRVAERLPEAVIFLAEPETPADDDPYKDFPIPDDLMW